MPPFCYYGMNKMRRNQNWGAWESTGEQWNAAPVLEWWEGLMVCTCNLCTWVDIAKRVGEGGRKSANRAGEREGRGSRNKVAPWAPGLFRKVKASLHAPTPMQQEEGWVSKVGINHQTCLARPSHCVTENAWVGTCHRIGCHEAEEQGMKETWNSWDQASALTFHDCVPVVAAFWKVLYLHLCLWKILPIPQDLSPRPQGNMPRHLSLWDLEWGQNLEATREMVLPQTLPLHLLRALSYKGNQHLQVTSPL